MVAGVLLIFKPEWILQTSGQEVETLIIAKIYAILMFTFGVVCYLLYKMFEYTDIFKRITLVIMAFHIMIAFQMYAAYSQGSTPSLGAFGLHMLLALLFLVSYMKDPGAFDKK